MWTTRLVWPSWLSTVLFIKEGSQCQPSLSWGVLSVRVLKFLSFWKRSETPSYVDVKQVLKVFQFLLDNLWPQNPSAKSARSMQFLIEELQIKPDLFLLFEVYRRILSLASPQVLGHYEVDRMKLEDRKWGVIISWMESKTWEKDIWGPEMSANFLSIYTFIANCNDFAYNNLRKSFKTSPIRGDIRCTYCAKHCCVATELI